MKLPQQILLIFFKTEKIWDNRTRARWFESVDTHARTMFVYPNYYKNLLILISTVPGVPFIFAGQETGEIKADIFSGTINESVLNFYKNVFAVRSQNPALKYGSIDNVWKSGDNTYAYLRSYENNNAIIILNFQNKIATSILDLPSQFTNGDVLNDQLNNEKFTISDPSKFQINIPAYGARILIFNNSAK